MAPTKYDNVIVFGPTGAVGNAAALEASKRGAKVWLAMRDTSKPINGISNSQGQDDKFPRVKADLSDPSSVKQAIETSKAKAAFVYLLHGPAGLKGALEAMKQAGIEYVVFLSSFTISEKANLRDIPPEEFIPYVHAQGEIILEDLGIAHTALRPGSFASNPFKMGMNTSKTPSELYVYSEGIRTVDNIVPLDIGRVAGSVLVDRPSSDKEIIYLYGPNLSNELETANTVSKLYSKEEVKVVQETPKQWEDRMRAAGTPEPLLQYFIKAQTVMSSELYSGDVPARGAANIKKYSGYEPTNFEDFVKSYDGRG